MKHDAHKIICDNYPTVAHKCMDLCDGKWQKNWIFLSDIMKECLGIYYQRYQAAYYAYNDKDCGISTDSFTYLANDRRFKIFNGRNAHRYQFPWALKLINQHNSYSCSGVYIGKGYVLTAKRNVEYYDAKQLRFGGGHFEVGRLKYSVAQRVFLHSHLDLALIKLKDPIENVAPICIAPKNKPLPAGFRIAGWGSSCKWTQIKHCPLMAFPKDTTEERQNCIRAACPSTNVLQFTNIKDSPKWINCETYKKEEGYICADNLWHESQPLAGDSGTGWIAKEKYEQTGCADNSDVNIKCSVLKLYGCEANLLPNTSYHVVTGYLKENCELTCNHCTNPPKTYTRRWQLFGIDSLGNDYRSLSVDVHVESVFNWICERAPELYVPWACARVIH